MASRIVTVKLSEDEKVTLTSDSPDINSLVKAIVKQRETINPDSITVTCDDSKFDSEGFATIISEATKAFLEDLQIDKEKLNAAMEEIDKGATNPAIS